MQNELIYFNQSGFAEKIKNYESITAVLQNIVDDYNRLGLPQLASSNELYSLFFEPKELIFDKMTGGQDVVIGGLTVIKSKAIEILQKPAGYDKLIDAIGSCDATLIRGFGHSNERANMSIVDIRSTFELDDNGNVRMKESFKSLLINQYSLFATSKASRKALEFIKAVQQLYIDMDMKQFKFDIPTLVSKCILSPGVYHTDYSKLAVMPEGISYYNSQPELSTIE